EVVEVDRLAPEALEALLDLGAQRPRAAAARIATLRGDDEPLRLRREGPADRLLAVPAGVGVGGVDQPHPRVDRFPQEGKVFRRRRQAVGSEAYPSDLLTRD